jgi:hypothetical protein
LRAATRRNGIREERIVADAVSLAVWDVPMPVIAGETFAIKVGAKSASAHALAGGRVEVSDSTGAVVGSGKLGDTPLPGTEALFWAALDVHAPAKQQAAEYSVRCIAGQSDEAVARFSVAVAAKPQHTLTVIIKERDTAEALGDVEIRIGAFHARTDKSGRAELRVCKGEYQLKLWRTAHIAPPQPIMIGGDANIELTMVHVPEEHPDARWVR